MKKEELWRVYVTANPQFEGMATVTMSTAGLKKLFDQTYMKGFWEGVNEQKALEQMMASRGVATDQSVMDMFNEVFGKKR